VFNPLQEIYEVTEDLPERISGAEKCDGRPLPYWRDTVMFFTCLVPALSYTSFV
jgi:hypothetical protein